MSEQTPTTLLELVSAYCATNPGIRSKNSESLYKVCVRHFARYLGREPELCDFTDRKIVAFMRFRRGEGMAEATVDNEGKKLCCLWRWAAERPRCWIDPPTLKISCRKPNAPKGLMAHEIRALFRAARRAKGSIGSLPLNVYFPALLGLVWFCGERITSARSVKRDDFDFRHRIVTFRNRKQRGSDTPKRMNRATAKACRKVLAASALDQPFAETNPSTVYYHMDALLVTAGIPADRRNKFHALRRSHASYLKKAGGDAVTSLGHDNESTTRTYYYDTRIIGGSDPGSFLFNPFSLWSRLLATFGY